MALRGSRGVWARIAMGAGLLVTFVGLGVYQEVVFSRTHMLGSDYILYQLGVMRAWARQNPYQPLDLGDGHLFPSYLYPPPSLLLFALMAWIAPARVGPVVLFVALSVIGLVVCLIALARATRVSRWWWKGFVALLLMTSAGMLETWHCGQINVVVVVLTTGFWLAWRREQPAVASGCLAAAICLKTTPLALLVFYLTPRRLAWTPIVVAMVAGWLLLSVALIPQPRILSAFGEAMRMGAGDPHAYAWNNSLSVSIASMIVELTGWTPSWEAVHTGKLALLGAMVGLVYLPYALRGTSERAGAALFVAITVAMVLAPNLVWLHHAALLAPAIWVLLVECELPLVRGLTLVALLLMQAQRFWQWHLAYENTYPFAIAQLLLIAAALRFAAHDEGWRFWRAVAVPISFRRVSALPPAPGP
jgi:hypothetical protein